MASREFKQKPLYKEITVNKNRQDKAYHPGTTVYKGVSTVDPDGTSSVLHDLAIIKQDLLNHFHIKRGEKLSDPMFGCILWDLLFEPLTDTVKEQIIDNVNEIIDYEPRVNAENILLDEYEHGLAIYCELTYLPYNISETMRINFDKNAGYASF